VHVSEISLDVIFISVCLSVKSIIHITHCVEYQALLVNKFEILVKYMFMA